MKMRGWTRSSTTAVLAGWLVLGAPDPGHAQAPPRSPEDLQRALQQRYALVLDFSADFIQSYEGGVLSTRSVERGTMLMKKPGRWRWNYLEPDPKLFVSDGTLTYFYLPEDQLGILGRVPEGNQATTAFLFLAGAGNVVDDYTAAFDTVQDPPTDSHYVLRLTPTRPERDFEFLTLVIDGRTLAIRRLISHDLQGAISTFFISNLQENLGLSDTPFTFEFPSGTDINDTTQPDALR